MGLRSLYILKKVIDDTIPSYYLETFAEGHNEVLLKKTTIKKNKK